MSKISQDEVILHHNYDNLSQISANIAVNSSNESILDDLVKIIKIHKIIQTIFNIMDSNSQGTELRQYIQRNSVVANPHATSLKQQKQSKTRTFDTKKMIMKMEKQHKISISDEDINLSDQNEVFIMF